MPIKIMTHPTIRYLPVKSRATALQPRKPQRAQPKRIRYSSGKALPIKALKREAIRILVVSAGVSAVPENPTENKHRQSVALANIKLFEALSLSLWQLRQLKIVILHYHAQLDAILTVEQLARINALRDQAAAGDLQPIPNIARDLLITLELSDEQMAQILVVRQSMERDLQDLLTPEQLQALADLEL